MTKGRNIALINLGCARNVVDSQMMLGRLPQKGHTIADLADAQVAIVNTCAFIEAAKRESIDTILDLIELKKRGRLKKIIVAGCLAQRYSRELAQEFKEIDAVIGVQKLERDKIPVQVPLTPQHFSYLKICESCYNRCRFCIIPQMKGKFVSRGMESVIEEVKQLDAKGTREINIIGQDITAYGMDIYHRQSLAELLKRITAVVKNIQWIRLLYTFPAHVTDELIDVMAGEEKICKYIDMPLQHISDHLLESMNRNITTRQTKDLIQKIRAKMPAASLRTTFIVGLPGETPEDFEELLEFVKATRFEKVGVFAYSREEGTPAYDMPRQVPDRLKRQRLDILMKAQRGISQAIQEQFIGRTVKVLMENYAQGVYVGRTQYDAPEVDGVVDVHSPKTLPIGDFVQVKITDASEYDLAGEAL